MPNLHPCGSVIYEATPTVVGIAEVDGGEVCKSEKGEKDEEDIRKKHNRGGGC